MKILFIGGTGVISSACTALALDQGFELYLLTRGQSFRPIPPGVQSIQADIRQPDSVVDALRKHDFDVVVDWIAFNPQHIEIDLSLFQDRTLQYIFISSASVYQTPPAGLPVSESTPLYNPIWAYSQAKIACEERLVAAYRQTGFPITIIRPSHTYDKTLLPFRGGYTMLGRMLSGQPVIVHGDGTSLWTLTHHQDFAKGFLGLIANPHAIGQAVHITSDETLTWNQIYSLIAKAAGAEPKIVHVPSDLIANYNPDWGASLLGDKAHSMVFDNTKIKQLVPGFQATIPFARGAREIVSWYLANPSRQQLDPEFTASIENILAAYQLAWPQE